MSASGQKQTCAAHKPMSGSESPASFNDFHTQFFMPASAPHHRLPASALLAGFQACRVIIARKANSAPTTNTTVAR